MCSSTPIQTHMCCEKAFFFTSSEQNYMVAKYTLFSNTLFAKIGKDYFYFPFPIDFLHTSEEEKCFANISGSFMQPPNFWKEI